MRVHFRNNIPVVILPPRYLKVAKRLFGVEVGALAIFPFIVVRDKAILNNADYIRHESIHIRQYIETLVVGLVIVAFFQYLYARVVLRKTKLQSYYYMSHEQEAHQNDRDPEYFKKRKWFTFYRYLLPKYRKRMDYIEGKRIIYPD